MELTSSDGLFREEQPEVLSHEADPG